ncbi:hypothetical protein HYZ64_03650 [Candidatus Berkelbacteria bacterium]|nr:hypothetical protein [Candidatus Berkelbacteria bacterium]
MADEPTTIEDGSEEPTRYAQAQRAFADKVNELRTIAGTLNKLKMVIPVTQAAIQFAFAALTTLGPIAAVIMIIVVVLVAGAAFFVYYRQPSRLLRAQGAHEPEPFNGENSVDRENLLRVQSAAGLISNLQRELATGREAGAQRSIASSALDTTSLPEADKQLINNKLDELEKVSLAIGKSDDPATIEGLANQFAKLKNDYYRLAAEKVFAGAGNRLAVTWRFQPAGATNCNYYAAFMTVLYHAIDQGKYSKTLENAIRPGAKDPARSCPKETKEYMAWAADQAGLAMDVVEVRLRGPNNSPSEEDWSNIKQIVTQDKRPVVIGTKFSKSGNQFLTIVGFGTEQGKDAVYVNDPGDRKAKAVIDPEALHASFHYRDDSRWSGGEFPKYLYFKPR